MNEQSIIERLEKLERQVYGKADEKLVYDSKKLYVGIKNGEPYIMAGETNAEYFRFHTFGLPFRSTQGWAKAHKTGQECLDYHIKDGFDITVFDDTREALEFFLSKL